MQANLGQTLLLADGLAQWGIVVGPEAPVRALIHTTVDFSRDGEIVETKTPGETMDDPYLSLSRLCRLLHKHGLGLEPGQPVITAQFVIMQSPSQASIVRLFPTLGSCADVELKRALIPR